MRKLLGGVVLVAGVGGLGWYGSANNADRMQSEVGMRAATIAGTATYDVQSAVSGRDIIASGIVADQAEFDTLETAFNGVKGRRVVDMSAVTILPAANPFEMIAMRAKGGSASMSGVIDSEDSRAIVAGASSDDLADALVWSSGVPDADWATVGATTYDALGLLKSGEMTLSGQDLTVRGLAATPTERAAFEDVLAGLPDAYTVSSDIDVEDDGTPMRLNLSTMDGAVEGDGKFPAGFAASEVTDRFDERESVMIEQAAVAGDLADWPSVATVSMDALAALIEGQLVIDGADVRLAGVASPDGKAQAEAALAALPEGYTVSTDISLFDDGKPFTLSMMDDGNVVTATGKVPAGYIVSGPDGGPVNSTVETAFINDAQGGFSANAPAGLAALAALNSGELFVSSDQITLTGLANSASDDAAIDAALAAVGDGIAIERTITYLDDGSPTAWSISYDAAIGANLGGKIPQGLAADAIADAMTLSDVQGAPIVSQSDPFDDNALEVLAAASEYLPETETLTYSNEDGVQSLAMVMSPGVNLDLVAADLAQRLPGNVAFSVSSLEELPDVGAVRLNVALNQRQRFQFGNWLPILTFAPVPAVCRDQSQAALEGSGVNFLSARAALDGKSVRAINALAAIAQRCVGEGGLTLEVRGHTDSSGTEISNQLLSENRAMTVRDALIARGVDADAIRAIGFGQSQPIGDNDTKEGRAANRRTEISWTE